MPSNRIAAILLAIAALLGLGAPVLALDTGLSLTLESRAAHLGPISGMLEDGRPELTSLYLAGDLAILSLRLQWRLGVVPPAWGPSPAENLLYSGRQGLPSLWIESDFRGMEILPALHYENFYAKLAPRDGDRNRCLIGRRYTFGGARWQAGFTETVLLSGDFSLYYLIPYPFFPISVGKVFLTESGVGDPRDANMLYGGDLKFTSGGSSAYLALMIDEAPLTRAWNGPYRIGIQLGGEWKEIRGHPGYDLWSEYTAISRYAYTYLEGFARGDYADGGEPIGHPLGPDADLLRIRLAGIGPGENRLWLELARERHGEGRLGDRWDPDQGRVLEFLTGIVETSFWLSGGLETSPNRPFRLNLTLGAARVWNLGNQAGRTGWDGRVSLGMDVVF